MATPMTMQSLAERFTKALRAITGWRLVLGEVVNDMLSLDTQDRAVEVIRTVAPNARQVLGLGPSRVKTDPWALTKTDIMALRQEFLVFGKEDGLRYENHHVTSADLDTLNLPPTWRAQVVERLAAGTLRVKDLEDAVKATAAGRRDKAVERLMVKVAGREVAKIETDKAPYALVQSRIVELDAKIERARKALDEMIEHRKRLAARARTLESEAIEDKRLMAHARAADAAAAAPTPKRKRAKAETAQRAAA